jgi:hypothetical protein
MSVWCICVYESSAWCAILLYYVHGVLYYYTTILRYGVLYYSIKCIL